MLTIGIDVGGTFTDLVAIDAGGRTVFAKALSTPQDQSVGVMAGLDELAQRLGLSRADMLKQTGRLVHGTTVATNAPECANAPPSRHDPITTRDTGSPEGGAVAGHAICAPAR